MTIFVSHQAVPPHFTTKLRPWYHIYVFREGCSFRPTSARCEVSCSQQ